MVERVFWHIGQPKTGTTYLQQILWENRELLARDGVTLPGMNHRRHLWAALEVMENPKLAQRDPRAPGTWEALCAELDEAEGTGLITHEFFCGADAAQVARAVERLAPAEVHVLITARDAAGMLAAGWQEMVKNGGVEDLRQVASSTERNEFSWWTWDLAEVLDRWGQAVPPEQIHVLPVPDRSAVADQHWRNFAGTLGLGHDYEMPEAPINQSLGAVQIEVLRQVNAHLSGFGAPVHRGKWIRGYLAEGHLAQQAGERLRLDDELLADCRARSRRAVDLIAERGHLVVGDVERLLVPDRAPGGRALAEIAPEEAATAAARLVAAMLADVRDLDVARVAAESRVVELEAPQDPAPTRWEKLRSRISRPGRSG